MKSSNWLKFKKKVRFGDCDSAGVLHFHNLLRWAHELWEESLENYGIPMEDIFPSQEFKNKIIFPIINCEAKFFSPIKLGDLLTINISPKKINRNLFQVNIFFFKDSKKVAESNLVHCSIDSIKRNKIELPDTLELWIEASNINNVVQEYR